MTGTERIIIIGGGQAGSQAAVSLRQAKFDGTIDLFCAEAELPYQRPPLSKAYLKGDLAAERLYFRNAASYEEQAITVHLSQKIASLNPAKKTIVTEAGDEHGYDKLLLATGAPPRRLPCPGADLQEIYYLRSIADSDALRAVLKGSGPVAIVGAGYIGLEVAAVLRQAGREVSVIEATERVLARVASPPVSAFFERRHREAGVDLRLGIGVEGFSGEGSVHAVTLADGSEIACTAVLVGIGAVPEIALAEQAGINVGNGIFVDDHARTSDPYIWAVGDCAFFPSPRYQRSMRLESVPNAIEHAKAAATNMAGGDVVYDALPWFWSDQYETKLQTVGLMEGYDQLVVRGDPDKNVFSVWYFASDNLIAVDAISDPAAFMVAKKLLGNGASPTPVELADPATDLKGLLKR